MTTSTVQTETLKTEAQYLEPGDFLTGSKRTVLGVTHAGVDIPSGKVEVTLRSNRTRTVLFGATTTVQVRRASVEAQS